MIDPLAVIVAVIVVAIVFMGVLRFAPKSKEKPKGKKPLKDNKQMKKAQDKLKAIRDMALPVRTPETRAPPPKETGTTETQGDVSSLAEFPIDKKIGIEMS